MVYAQPGIIIQVAGALTHAMFWAATVLVYHYSDYCNTHRMRGTSDEETLREKEAYERLAATHGSRVYTYRADNGRFADTLFKEEVQAYGQQIS